jgi:hypothetical protein
MFTEFTKTGAQRMRDTKDLLDFEIYPNLDRVKAVKEFNPNRGFVRP